MENNHFKRTGKDLKSFTYTARPVLNQHNHQVLPAPCLKSETMISKNFPIKPFIYLDDSEKIQESQKMTSSCFEKLEQALELINPVICRNPVNFNEICGKIQKDIQNLDEKKIEIFEKSEEKANQINSEIVEVKSKVLEADEQIRNLTEKKKCLDNVLKEYQQTIKMFQSLTLIDIQEIYEGQEKYRAVAGKKDRSMEFLLEREENGEYLYEFLSSNLNNLDDLPIWKSRASFEYKFLRDFYLSLVEKINS